MELTKAIDKMQVIAHEGMALYEALVSVEGKLYRLKDIYATSMEKVIIETEEYDE